MSTDYSSGPKSAVLRIVRPFLALVAGIACVVNAYGQTLIPGLSAGGGMRPLQTDLEALESRQPRRDLQCDVTALKPELGFDFMFQTGYEVRVPIRELAGDGNELTVLFRVVPEDRPDASSYMVQKVPVPVLEAHGGGEGKFYGIFTLGEGKYHVDWLMRDQRERTCSLSWDLETTLNSRDSQLKQWIPKSLVQPRGPLFASEPPIIRTPEGGSPRFSIIVNFDPSDPSAALIDEPGLYGLLAILRRMGRDPRIEPYSIIICSVETQQVVYQQESRSSIDFTALEKALGSVKLGTVDAKRLISTNSPAQFVADLIREQLHKENSDALVVIGPKGGAETRVSRQALESFDKLGKPAFYLSYVTGQQGRPRRDPISSIMQHLRGFEYRIDRPKDFFNAWSDVVARIVRTMQAPHASIAATAATQ
jgi:hypothetical protein